MGVTSIVSFVLGLLAVGVMLIGFFGPVASMTGAENECTDGVCTERSWTIQWTYNGERVEQREKQAGQPATQNTTTSTWGERAASEDDQVSDGAVMMQQASSLAFVAMGLAALGAVLVLVGRFTHPAVGIGGGVLGVLSVLAVGGAVGLVFPAIDSVGNAFSDSLRAADNNWATKGPYYNSWGLWTFAAGGLLALIGGILGLVPGGYRD